MSMSLAMPLAKGPLNVIELALYDVVSLADAGALNKTMKQLLRQRFDAVVVDLKQVADMDKACLDHLVSAARRIRRQDGYVVLRHCSEALFSKLQAYGWDRCFLIPERRAADINLLSEDLQAWVLERISGRSL
jgi:anti-anti-sigma regulatory factor